SKGENIDQLTNKKTQVVAKDKSNIIKKGDSPVINIIQGISESTTIKVHINFENEPDKPLSEYTVASKVNYTAYKIRAQLVNKDSFVPKIVIITVNGDSLGVSMEYIAKDSHGENVISYYESKFKLNDEYRYEVQ
ncbi:MAG: hypothetical protein ACKOXD_10600, partial [Acinetobacter sp.]